MSAKFCLTCGALHTSSLSHGPSGGHTQTILAGGTPTKRRSRALSLGMVATASIIIVLTAVWMCTISAEHQNVEPVQALARTIGYQEKQFLSERFASTEGIALYRSMIDHELEIAENRGNSELLDDQLPENIKAISARSLSDAYARDELDADARYRDHTLLVEAHINAIQDASLAPCVSVRGRDGHHDVQACLRDKRCLISDADLLTPGSTRRLICRGEGNVLNMTMLGSCVPQIMIFRDRAQALKRSAITQVTRGQLFTRLRDVTHPLYHTKPLMLILHAQFGADMLPACRHGALTTPCQQRLQKVRDEEVNSWLQQLFKAHGIAYGT